MLKSLSPRDVVEIQNKKYIFVGRSSDLIYLVDIELQSPQTFIVRLQLPPNVAIKKLVSPLNNNMVKWPKKLLASFIMCESKYASAKDPELAGYANRLIECLLKNGAKSHKFSQEWSSWREQMGARGFGRSQILKSRRIVQAIKRRHFMAKGKSPAVYGSLPFHAPPSAPKVNKTVPYDWYPQIPNWAMDYGVEFNLIEAAAYTSGQGPSSKLSYRNWFKCAYPYGKAQSSRSAALYHLWYNNGQGNMADLDIKDSSRYGKSYGPGYYMSRAFLKFPFPKGTDWRLPFWPVATVSRRKNIFETEIRALTGNLNLKGEHFRHWFHENWNKNKVTGCPTHKFNPYCIDCARKIYNLWYPVV